MFQGSGQEARSRWSHQTGKSNLYPRTESTNSRCRGGSVLLYWLVLVCFRGCKNYSYNVLNVQPFCSLNYPFLPPFNSNKRQSTSFFYTIFYCLCTSFPSKLGGLIFDICSVDVELYIHNTCFTRFKQLTLFEIQWPEINAAGKEIFIMSGVLFVSDNQPVPLCFTELLCRSLYVTHFQIIWGYILPRSKVLWWYYPVLCMPKKRIPFPESDRNETNIRDTVLSIYKLRIFWSLTLRTWHKIFPQLMWY